MERYALRDRPDGSVEIVEMRPVVVAHVMEPALARRMVELLGLEARAQEEGGSAWQGATFVAVRPAAGDEPAVAAGSPAPAAMVSIPILSLDDPPLSLDPAATEAPLATVSAAEQPPPEPRAPSPEPRAPSPEPRAPSRTSP